MVNVKRLSFTLFLTLALAFSFASIGMAKDKNIVNVWMWEINNWDPNLCNSDGARILSNIYEQLVRVTNAELFKSFLRACSEIIATIVRRSAPG